MLSYSAFAQDTAHKKKWEYFGLHQAGMVAGSNAEKLSILTTNGLQKGNWHAGISTGIDWYGIRSIPLLASVYKTFGTNKHQPFVYGSAGVGFAWREDIVNRFYSYEYKNGFAGEVGLGYFFNLKNKTAFTLAAGFSYKQMGVTEKRLGLSDATIYSYANTTEWRYNYYYRRIAIRLGIKI